MKERDDGSFELHGLGAPARIERELWNCLSDRGKVSVNLLSEGDVEHHDIDGHHILVIHVPRAPRAERPVYLSGQWDEAYIRVGEGDRKVDRERARRMLADAEYDTRDDRVLPHLDIADLDSDALKAYRNLFLAQNPDHPWNSLGLDAFLERLGASGTDPSTGDTGLTRAGLLMFGTDTTIRKAFPNYFLDYQERPVLDDPTRWDDRITPDGAWSGNLFDFFLRVTRKLQADLKVPFALDDNLYRKDQTHVHEAVREALVNCLVHADFEGRSRILIVKSPEGFFFRNPGMLRIPLSQVRAGGESDCRNRTLQLMFRKVGFGEQAGAGISRILRAWSEQHWRVPLIEEAPETDATSLRLSMTSLLPQETLDELGDRFGGRFAGLDEHGRLAVATAHHEGRVTNRSLQAITDAHPRDLTFLFQRLVADGLLERHGDRRGSWYTVAEAEGHSPHNGPDSPHNGPDSPHNGPDSPHSGPDSAQSSTKNVAPDPVAVVAGARRSARSAVEAAILTLCRGRFLSSGELARHLNRSQKTVAENYLPPLVAAGRLELKNPASLHASNQAYRAKEPSPEAPE